MIEFQIKDRFQPKVVYYPFGLVTHRSPHSFNLLLTNRTPRRSAGFRFIQVTHTTQVPSFTWIYSWTILGVIRIQTPNEGFNQTNQKYLGQTWQARQLWLQLKFRTFAICSEALRGLDINCKKKFVALKNCFHILHQKLILLELWPISVNATFWNYAKMLLKSVWTSHLHMKNGLEPLF